MVRFFDVSPGLELVNPMFGPAHLVAIVGLLCIVPVIWLARDRLRRVSLRGPVVRGAAWFILADQLLLLGLCFAYDYEPYWERFPLHLCSFLCWFVPVMTLLGRFDLVRYVGIWALGAGAMAIINMNIPHTPVASYLFLHYLWMHYYLVAVPSFLAVRGEMRMTYVGFLGSLGGLVVFSAVVFVVDWVLDVNFMYIGPSSTLDVPFIPAAWRVWPWSYPTFMGIGIVLFHAIYAVLRWTVATPREPARSIR